MPPQRAEPAAPGAGVAVAVGSVGSVGRSSGLLAPDDVPVRQVAHHAAERDADQVGRVEPERAGVVQPAADQPDRRQAAHQAGGGHRREEHHLAAQAGALPVPEGHLAVADERHRAGHQHGHGLGEHRGHPHAERQDVEQHDVGDQADAAHQPEGGELRGQAVAQDARDEGHPPEGSPAPALWLPGTVRTGVTDRLPA